MTRKRVSDLLFVLVVPATVATLVINDRFAYVIGIMFAFTAWIIAPNEGASDE